MQNHPLLAFQSSREKGLKVLLSFYKYEKMEAQKVNVSVVTTVGEYLMWKPNPSLSGSQFAPYLPATLLFLEDEQQGRSGPQGRTIQLLLLFSLSKRMVSSLERISHQAEQSGETYDE